MIRLSVHFCVFYFSILNINYIYSTPVKYTCENGLNLNSCIRTLDYDQHLNHLDHYFCGHPIPHFFAADKIDELRSQLLKHHLTRADVEPHGTIVHRCRSCGYCTSLHEKCTHMTSEIISLEFQTFTKPNLRFEIQLVNHTSCHCVNIKAPELLNRTKHNRKRHRKKKRKRLRPETLQPPSNS